MGNGRNGDELSQGMFFLRLTSVLVLKYSVKLVTADEKKTVVAEFHRAHHFTKKQKARLDVQPAGMGMLDYIVLTLVFAENKRRERETRARTAAASH
jgi:hypothetical protein